MDLTSAELLVQAVLRQNLASADLLEGMLREIPAGPGGPRDEDLIAALAIRRIATEERLRAMLAEELQARGAPGFQSGTLSSYPSAAPRGGRFLRMAVAGASRTGPVWTAWDFSTRRRVVLKRLAPEGQEATEEQVRVARAATRLVHTHIAPAVDVAEELDGAGLKVHVLASEHVDGAGLDKAPPTPERAVRLVRDAALALHEAHVQGLVHGVIKPRNLLVGSDGRVRLLDFGQAMVTHGRDVRTAADAAAVAFAAPEQIAAGPVLSPLVDVYSLGATLYFVLTEQAPFTGASAHEVGEKILNAPTPSPRAAKPEVPEELDRIVVRAMAREPMRRYRTAGLLAEDLDRWLQRKPLLTEEEMLQSQALGLLRDGRLEESIHLLRELKRRTKEHPEGALGRARASLAAPAADTRNVEDPRERVDRGRTRLALAVLLFLSNKDSMEHTAGAILDFDKALEAEPDLFEARLLRGVALLLRARFPGHEDAAEINLERAAGDLGEASLSPPLRAAALHNRAVARYYLSRRKKEDAEASRALVGQAIEDLEAALAADPFFAFAHKDLGVLRLAHVKADPSRRKLPSAVLQEVLGHLTRAVDLCPDLDGALLERGKILYGLKKYDEAIADWKRCGAISASRGKEAAPLIADAERQKTLGAGPAVR